MGFLPESGLVGAVLHPDNADTASTGEINRGYQRNKKLNGLVADVAADFGCTPGGANNTAKYEEAISALLSRGGGTLWWPYQGDWYGDLVDVPDHISLAGPRYLPRLHPWSSSSRGVMTTAGHPRNGCDVVGLTFCGDGNDGQWAIYAQGDGSGDGDDGGWWHGTIDIQLGEGLEPGGLWLRGGGDDGKNPHQGLKVYVYGRDTVGRPGWVGVRLTGQIGQCEFPRLWLGGPGGDDPVTEWLMRIEREVDDDGDYISDQHAYNLEFGTVTLEGAHGGVLIDRTRVADWDNTHFENVKYPVKMQNSAVAIDFDATEFAACGLDNGDGALFTVENSWGTYGTTTWQGEGDGPDNVVLRNGSTGAMIPKGTNNLPSGHSSDGLLYQLNVAGGLDFSHHRFVGIVGDGATTVQQMTNTIAEGEVFKVLALGDDVLFNQSGNLVIPQGSTHVLTQANGAISSWVRQGVKLWLEHAGEGSSIA